MQDMDRSGFINQLYVWHENDEHQRIIDAIEGLTGEERDYELYGLYVRALNNAERYEDALEQLMVVEEQGREDGIWHYRKGYSLYYLNREDEAAESFQRAIDLGDDSEDTRTMLKYSQEEAEARRNQALYNPVLYDEKETQCIESHIEKYFGKFKNVFHEVVSPDIHVDIAVIEPSPKNNYYILVTMGMGARPMNMPEELQNQNMERVELMICLPPDWRFDDLENEEWYWPMRWLKILARLPIEENTWLGWGHTIPSGGPFASNTGLSTILLLNPGAFNPKSFECALPNGAIVNFYQLIPLYTEETEFKTKNNTEILLNFLDSDCLEYIHLDRENVCKE
jgi:tetratricopeptide (TPR) repeat protein